jgi:excisionase family DNA binding protein
MNTVADPPVGISSKESEQIRALRQLVQEGPIKLVGAKGRRAELPFAVVGLLDEILKNLQAGKAVSVVPEHQQLTTQRAANLLGVSRPFMVRLLEEGHLPFHMVGSHRRVYLKDLLAYQKRRDAERHDAINRMARMELEAGTYDKVVLPEGAEER